MNWWQRLWRRRQMEEQLEKEVRFHLDQQTNDLIAHGHDPKEARRQARLTFGGPEQVKEECRDARGTRWLEDLWQDSRYALRTLRKKPGFAAVSVLTLALGIGASTAIFSAVDPILFEPLPYPHAGRIVMIWDVFNASRSDVTFHSYRELVERSRSFDAIAVMKPWQPTMTGPAGTIEWAERERELLPCAGRIAGARTRLPGVRRSVQGSQSSDSQRRIVAAALRRRQDDRGARGQARRRHLYRHRRDAARVRARPGSLGRVM